MPSQSMIHRFRSLEVTSVFDESVTAEDRAQIMKDARFMMEQASKPDCHLLRIDDVYGDIAKVAEDTGYVFRSEKDWQDLPRLAFPFATMWLEGRLGPDSPSMGALVHREGNDVLITIAADVFIIDRGKIDMIFPCASIFVETDAAGRVARCILTSVVAMQGNNSPQEATYKDIVHRALGFAFACVHAFARLGCKNVTFEAIPGQFVPKNRKVAAARPNCSVWHRIVVHDMPRRKPSQIESSGKRRDIRHHWVRGHFADYTEGKGLFGKYRDVFWMPEHTRGNFNLGTVKQEHVIK